MISFTKRAEEEILKTLRSGQIPEGYGLRLGLSGGACSSRYVLGLDKAGGSDEEILINGINVFIDKRHLMYLIGVEVDYSEEETARGFTVSRR